MRYTCAIFDLDGTLLNTLDDLKNALNGALAARGYATRTLEEVRMFIGNGVGKLVERATPKGTASEEMQRIIADFRARYDRDLNVETHPYAASPRCWGGSRPRGSRWPSIPTNTTPPSST